MLAEEARGNQQQRALSTSSHNDSGDNGPASFAYDSLDSSDVLDERSLTQARNFLEEQDYSWVEELVAIENDWSNDLDALNWVAETEVSDAQLSNLNNLSNLGNLEEAKGEESKSSNINFSATEVEKKPQRLSLSQELVYRRSGYKPTEETTILLDLAQGAEYIANSYDKIKKAYPKATQALENTYGAVKWGLFAAGTVEAVIVAPFLTPVALGGAYVFSDDLKALQGKIGTAAKDTLQKIEPNLKDDQAERFVSFGSEALEITTLSSFAKNAKPISKLGDLFSKETIIVENGLEAISTKKSFTAIDGVKYPMLELKNADEVWGMLSHFERGTIFEKALGQNLMQNFKTFDIFNRSTGEAISIKTMHLDMPTYQTPSKLFGKLKQHVDKVAEFIEHGKDPKKITFEIIKKRSLIVGVPDLNNPMHLKVLTNATEYAKSKNVSLNLVLIKKSVKR